MTTTELRQYIDKVLGNSIRCLLPSYWWKRLFSQVADRIDEVEQSASELVEESKMPIVGSEAALKRLDVKDGNLASVLRMETRERSFGELYQLSFAGAVSGVYTNCTEVKDIITKAPSLDVDVTLMFGTADGSRVFDILVAGAVMKVFTHENKELKLYVNGEYVQEGHDYLREELSSFQYKYIIAIDYSQDSIAPLYNYDLIDPFLTCVATLPEADVYVKGNTWDRLAKAGESGGSSGGGSITEETDPVFSASPAASITNEKMTAWDNKQDKITDLQTIREGAAKGATALQNVKTINGESLVGEGDITIKADVDTSTLATKEELNDLAEEIVINKEVHAAALTDLNTRLNALSENVTGKAATKDELQETVEYFTTTIEENEEVHAAAINDLNDRLNALAEGGEGGSSSGNGAYAEVNHGTSDTTFALTPNTFHVWDEVSALTLTLGSETAGVANEFLFQFTSGTTATSLTLPDDIKWANDSAPTIAENMIYQVSILKGLASVLEFSNAPSVVENKVTVSISGTEYLVSLQYAAASDIVVKVRTSDGAISVSIPSGEISKSASSMGPMVDSGAYVELVTPQVDSKYIYTW